MPGASGTLSTYEESLAYGAMMNRGTRYKVLSYRNGNGYSIFRGYQSGRLALSTFKRFNGADYIVFRGSTKKREDLFTPRERIKKLFKQSPQEVVVHDIDGLKVLKGAVERVATKKVSQIKNFKRVGYGKKINSFQTLLARDMLLKNKINKFKRNRDLSAVRESRLKRGNLQKALIGQENIQNRVVLGANNLDEIDNLVIKKSQKKRKILSGINLGIGQSNVERQAQISAVRASYLRRKALKQARAKA